MVLFPGLTAWADRTSLTGSTCNKIADGGLHVIRHCGGASAHPSPLSAPPTPPSPTPHLAWQAFVLCSRPSALRSRGPAVSRPTREIPNRGIRRLAHVAVRPRGASSPLLRIVRHDKGAPRGCSNTCV